MLNETVTALRNEVVTYVTLHIVCYNNGSSFRPVTLIRQPLLKDALFYVIYSCDVAVELATPTLHVMADPLIKVIS